MFLIGHYVYKNYTIEYFYDACLFLIVNFYFHVNEILSLKTLTLSQVFFMLSKLIFFVCLYIIRVYYYMTIFIDAKRTDSYFNEKTIIKYELFK